ncbi:MAG: methyltransferase domain-containing protein [Rhodobacteraceae bacterium]|nr:methyltransferase domain-containing protein [Paracoccaceae bacterium]
MKHDEVREYYGKVLQGSGDLQTNACCTPDDVPRYLRDVLAKIHPEVNEKYYGCGLVAPMVLSGASVLDLGSGSGRDVYALAGLVGKGGSVVGVDMTDEQLDVARRHEEFHARAFGYPAANTSFHKGYIEKLDELGLADASFDIIVSNCVINLSPDKPAVLREAFRLLKPGGELYFSDVYADRRVPEALLQDPVLYGECLSGALYWNDFLTLAKEAGFADPRLVEDRVLTIENPEIEAKLGDIGFHSATYRLFKLNGLEPACEDYGQSVAYKGTMPLGGAEFVLDKGHVFAAGKEVKVCGNTYRMLAGSRFAPYFEFSGDFSTHYGIFAGCGDDMPFDTRGGASSRCC